MKQAYKRLLSLLLAIVLFTTGLTPALAANPQEQGGDVPALETLELERPVLPDKDFAFSGSPDIRAIAPVLEPLVTLDSGMPPEANSRSRNAIVGTIVANPNDVAAMNAIIIKYQLPGISPWTEGVYPEAWHAYVQWEEIPGQGGRTVALNLSDKKIAGSLDVSQLTALRKLYSSNSQLTALSDNLPESLTELFINSNQLTALPRLPPSLEILNCGENYKIQALPELPESLKELWIANNEIKQLPALPDGLCILVCTANRLTALPALPDSLIKMDCGINRLTELPELPQSLEWLLSFGTDLQELPALPDSLTHLDCSSNQLTELPALPPTLIALYCRWNPIKKIPALPQTLEALSVQETLITELPKLPQGLKLLECGGSPEQRTALPALPALPDGLTWLNCSYWNNLTALPELPQGLTHLICGGNPLKELPELPQTLEILLCTDTGLKALPPLPSSLTELYCGANRLTNLDVSNLPNLTWVACYHNQISELDISNSPNLEKLYCHNNCLMSKKSIKGLAQAAQLIEDVNFSFGAETQTRIGGGGPSSGTNSDIEKPFQVAVSGSFAEVTGAGSYFTDALVTIDAGTRNGYVFAGWTAPGVTFSTPYSSTIFRMSAKDVSITANWWREGSSGGSGGGSSGGGSSGGGGGGGSPVTDSTPAAPSIGTSTPSSVNSASAVKQTAEAVASALKSSGVAKASVFVQNVDFVSPQTLRNMAAAAKKAGGTVQLVADTVMNGKVVARLYLDATQAANLVADIQLGVSVSQTSTAVTSAKFEKYYGNKFSVVSMAQAGSFGMPVGVAVKVDLAGLNTKTLRFCSYDKSTNKFYAITSPGYRVDEKGFLHFSTPLGGDIIITDAPLSTSTK